jgi:hypothetical protein
MVIRHLRMLRSLLLIAQFMGFCGFPMSIKKRQLASVVMGHVLAAG